MSKTDQILTNLEHEMFTPDNNVHSMISNLPNELTPIIHKLYILNICLIPELKYYLQVAELESLVTKSLELKTSIKTLHQNINRWLLYKDNAKLNIKKVKIEGHYILNQLTTLNLTNAKTTFKSILDIFLA